MSLHTIYLLLGSNLPERTSWLAQGRVALAADCGAIIQASAIYETAAWGREDQPPFLNQALLLQSGLAPEALLAAIHRIEGALGRSREVPWGSRTLDIDILLYDDLVLATPALSIPHPYLPQRRFALVPLQELAPGLVHPSLHQTVAQLQAACTDPLPVQRYQPPL